MLYFSIVVVLLVAIFAPVQGECDGFLEPTYVTELNFTSSNLIKNELHLDDGELRYEDMGQVDNETVDLRVTVTHGTYSDIWDRWIDREKSNPPLNGMNRGFGRINLQSQGNVSDSGLGHFRFCIVKHGTDEELAPSQFHFTVYDEDQRRTVDNEIGVQERMFFDIQQAENFQLWPNETHSEVKLKCLDPNDSYPCPAGEQTIFHSSTHGVGDDNPRNPANLTDEQKSRSVAFTFQNRSCFDLSFELYCPVTEFPDQYTNGETCRKNGDMGGNFLFSGAAPEIIDEGECHTASPTTAPSDAPSIAPLDNPTNAPNMTPGGYCTVGGGQPENIGTLNMCLRSSLGYSYDPPGGNAVTFQEVNFIETLIQITYNMTSGFCVDHFSVSPKEKELTTIAKSYDLKAWLCEPGNTEDVSYDDSDLSKLRSLPKRVTKYNVVGGTGTDAGTAIFNQGALIDVCVATDNPTHDEGVVMQELTDFMWYRDDDGNILYGDLEQHAIHNSLPAGNFLTSYLPSTCDGADWCTFSSILFAEFYATPGRVYGRGNAVMKFPNSARRLAEVSYHEEARRRMQTDRYSSSEFDLSVEVRGNDDNSWTLKAAGGSSFGISEWFGMAFVLGIALSL